MNYWLIGFVALAVTVTTVPIIRLWLIRSNVLDHPNERSSHQSAVPRGGGVACLLGVISGIGLAAGFGITIHSIAICSALGIAGVGFVDDLRRLPAAPRLALQIAFGAIAGASVGGLKLALVGAVAAPVTVNVANFMDGINGITATNMAVWGVALATAAGTAGAGASAVIGAVTAGSSLGFLPWNAPRARLFLGDVGSYLFGGLILIGLLGAMGSNVDITIAMAPFLIPFTDVTVTLARRAYQRKPLTQAHREHTYQRVTRLGISHTTAALTIGALSGALTGVWAALPTSAASILTVAALISYVAWPHFLNNRMIADDTTTQ